VIEILVKLKKKKRERERGERGGGRERLYTLQFSYKNYLTW
jgi:hypothetical protein